MAQTVERAIQIIEFVADEPRTLGEVADHLSVHKSTALRLLQTLKDAGFARVVGGRYTVGFHMVAIALAAVDHLELASIAHPHLAALSERHGHTIHLAELIDDDIIYVDKVDGWGALKMQSRVGHSANLHTAGVAKAILAHLDDPARSRMLARATYQRYTATTLTTPQALLADLARTRERGWAEDDCEMEDFINCVAVPVRDARGNVVASVSITALKAITPLEQLRRCVPDLVETCTAISRDMGWWDR